MMNYISRQIPPIGGFPLMSAKARTGKIYPTSGAQFATMSGYATEPNSMWAYTAASGTDNDLIGSNHLTASGTLTRGQFDAQLGAKCVYVGNGVDGNLAAGDVFDTDASTSIAFILVARFPTSAGANQYRIFGKESGGGAGWNLRTSGSANGLRLFIYDGAAGLVTADVAHANLFDGRVVHIEGKIDRTADRMDLFTSVADATQANISSVNSADAAANFHGLGGTGNAPEVYLAFAAIWSGAGAEGLTKTHMTNFRTAQGF